MLLYLCTYTGKFPVVIADVFDSITVHFPFYQLVVSLQKDAISCMSILLAANQIQLRDLILYQGCVFILSSQYFCQV